MNKGVYNVNCKVNIDVKVTGSGSSILLNTFAQDLHWVSQKFTIPAGIYAFIKL
ncbi:MAG: hypothetical protein GXY91_02630 [Clostridia bacterium]|nr:hypothetical protein [Clostridia bacterium]